MKRTRYRHIIFDLDRTLWDFDANSAAALQKIYEDHALQSLGVPDLAAFLKTYHRINDGLWDDYRKGNTNRASLSLNRFLYTLRAFDIDDVALAEVMAADYVRLTSEMTRLFPYTHEALAYLHDRYQLHVLTNGFADVQYKKLDRSGLREYFTHIITSEEAGAMKPSPYIFRYALQKIKAGSDECLMVGDDPDVDLRGARNCGMDQMFVNRDAPVTGNEFTFEISHLDQIPDCL